MAKQNGRRVSGFRILATYPLPVIAIIGLLLGSLMTWVLGDPGLGSDAWLATLLLGGIPIVLSTIRGLLMGRFAADVVAMLAIMAAMLFGEGFAGTIIVLMQSGGEALEDYGMGRASSALDALAARAPRFATRVHDRETSVVRVEDVKPEDVLLVRKGELVPVDGVLSSEGADIDQSAITGEPLVRPKSKGDKLLSGSVNVGVVLQMRATKVSGESQYSKIVELVRHAQERKPRIQRLADRYAVWFTPLVVVVALVGVFLTGDPQPLFRSWWWLHPVRS